MNQAPKETTETINVSAASAAAVTATTVAADDTTTTTTTSEQKTNSVEVNAVETPETKAADDISDVKLWLSNLNTKGVVCDNCPVCKVPFATVTSGPNVPMLLSCGHTICAGCLAQLKGDEMKPPAVPCPLCGSLTPFHKGKPVKYSVMVNEPLIYVLNLKQKLSSKSPRVITCAECSNAAATVFCQYCAVPLCEKCNEAIHCGKVLASHRRIPVQEYEQQAEALPMCKIHQSPLDRFCVDDKTVCCEECMQYPPHIGHRTVPLSEAPNIILDLLSKSLLRYKEPSAMPRGPEEVLLAFQNVQKDIDSKAEIVNRAIMDMTETLRHAIEQRAQKLIQSLDEETMTLKQALQRNCDAAMMQYISAITYADAVSKACEMGTSGKFDSNALCTLVEFQKLVDEVNDKTTKPKIFRPELDLAPFLMGTEFVPDLMSEISKFGEVSMLVPPVLNVPNSTVMPNAVLVEWLFAGNVSQDKVEFELEMSRGAENPHEPLDFSSVYRGRESQFYVEGLDSGTKYVFRCRTVTPVGVSGWSKTKSITTERVQGFTKGPNYTVSGDGFTAEKLVSSMPGWNATVVGKLPLLPGLQHRWSIEVRKSAKSNIFIGVAPLTIDRTSEENGINCGYYMFLQNGSLYSGPPYNARGYNYANNIIPAGSVVGVVLDLARGIMGFTIHGRSAGLAFVNLPVSQPLVPVVLMHDPGDVVVFHDNIEVFSPERHTRFFN